MKVRMKVAVSGLRNGRPWPGIGETVELPDAEGADLCAAGMADPVAEKPRDKAEKAVPTEVEAEERGDEPQEARQTLTTETAESTVPKRGPGRPRKNT